MIKTIRKSQVEYNYRIVEKVDSDEISTFYVQERDTVLFGLIVFWSTIHRSSSYDDFDRKSKTYSKAKEYVSYLKNQVEPKTKIYYV